MLARSVKVELPRRVVVCYLLYSLLAVLWLAASALLATRSTVIGNAEAELLSYQRQAAATATLELAEHGPARLQPLVERFSREHHLLYCGFVAADDSFAAHSNPRYIGQTHHIVNGTTTYHQDVETVRYAGASFNVREYSSPIQAHGETAGRLIIAQGEPTLGDSLQWAARHAVVALCGSFMLLTLGGFTLHRLISPLAAVDDQLRQAALASSLADLTLAPLTSGSPGVLGWNRIVREFQAESPRGGLDQRVGDAIQSLRHGKSDDVLNSLTDGIAVSDHAGQITFANHAMAAMFAGDANPETLHGTDIETCLELDATQESHASLFDPELYARDVVEEIERGEGETRQFLRIVRHPICTAAGASHAGHVWTVRDVTQQMLANAMRDQFLDHATHELRTPLANIKAYAETLTMSDSIDIETQKDFCNTINTEATRLARLIDDLLSVSSMEAGSLTLNKQGVDLSRLFSEVVGKVKAQMVQKELEFETIFPAKYPPAKLDKDKVNVALVNLLGNAAKYTPEGGRVRFEVKITDREIRIEVEDTGVGISEEELPRICDKFFRSSNPLVQQITGTGLGLSMAHEVIKLHGGNLTVQSEFGVGTTFITTLPLE